MAGVFALVLASCASSSPAGRIERNPAIYESLSPAHQAEVRDGRISRGMNYDAVLLAWGRPSRRVDLMRPDGAAVRWDYTGTQPVYITRLYGDHGFGRCGRYGRHSRSAFAFGPEIDFVPYHRASVWFIKGEVDGWESVQ